MKNYARSALIAKRNLAAIPASAYVREPKSLLMVRFRFIKKRMCRCLHKPYLWLEVTDQFPYVRFFWGGPICVCPYCLYVEGLRG